MPLFPPVPIRQVAVTQDGAPVTPSTDPAWRLLFTRPWVQWFETIRTLFDQTFGQIGHLNLAAQGTGLTTTTVAANVAAGLYRVTYYVRVSRAATASSSIQALIYWTDGGVSQVFAGTALTGNTTDTQGSQSILIRADAGSDLDVETNYSSVGATTMQFNLDVIVEEAP